MKAVWNDITLAESDETVKVEGNVYFPPESLDRKYFRDSDKETVCAWKGTASYYDITVEGETNPSAAWYYHEPKPEAQHIKDYVSFADDIDITL